VGGLPALFLLVDAGMKFAKPAFVVEATAQLGYSERSILPLGAVLLASTILYLIPRTAVLGAVLLTGYLGGAVATHVFAHHGAFEIVFPVVFGILLWTGLVMRRENLLSVILKGDGHDQHVPAV
jgi:amino acid transporter